MESVTSVQEAVETKACCVCGIVYPRTAEHFYRQAPPYRHQLQTICRSCHRERCRKWRQEHKEQSKAFSKKWKEKNRELANERLRKRRAERRKTDLAYVKHLRDQQKRWRDKDIEATRARKRIASKDPKYREWCNQYKRTKYQEDINFKIAHIERGRIRWAFKTQGVKKRGESLDWLGCSLDFLRWWIESQFQPGMIWKNFGHGMKSWNIDHEYPCSYFDLTDERQRRICFGWTNLRPMWHRENMSKGKRVPTPDYQI